ncbi:MAG TPA: YdcF family protein [Candidatus Limnocylindrales bacterium]|nr:YdcF family protein [Candidatus Limnocylindrales bacterium]
MLRDLSRVGVACVAGLLLVVAYTTWRIWDQGNRDEARPADAIVVLGAAQYNGVPSPIYRARLDHAINLFEEGVASTLVMTGGKLPGDTTTEADAGRAYAVARGVPWEAIVVEDQGRTTLESLRTVGSMFSEQGLDTAVFVSDRTHMLRVLRIARDQGVEAFGSPTRTSPIDSSPSERLRATVHEVGALGLYFLAGTGP